MEGAVIKETNGWKISKNGERHLILNSKGMVHPSSHQILNRISKRNHT